MHTPEPWKVDSEWPCSIVDSTDSGIIECWEEGDNGMAFEPYDIKATEENAKSNAIRIVACVNACAGSTDDELKLIADMGGFDTAAVMRWEKVRELTQQREELLAAFEKYASHHNGCDWYGYGADTPKDQFGECSCGLIDFAKVVHGGAGIPTELIEQGGFAAIPVATHRELKQQRDELQAKCEHLESSLYNIGMDLEQLGLNTDDVTEALGGKDGIRQIEDRLAKAQEINP
jgi:hypothetical protein